MNTNPTLVSALLMGGALLVSNPLILLLKYVWCCPLYEYTKLPAPY